MVQYAKQRVPYILPFQLTNAELGSGLNTFEYEVEVNVSGRIKDCSLDFNLDNLGVNVGFIAVLTRDTLTNADFIPYEELANALITSTHDAVHIETNDTVFAVYSVSGVDHQANYKKKAFIDVNAGETLSIRFYVHTSADPSIGSIEGFIQFDLDVFKLPHYDQQVYNPSTWFTNNFLMVRDNNTSVMVAFPSDGWIDNVRITILGELELDEIVSFAQVRANYPEMVVDVLDDYYERGYAITGAQDFTTEYAQTSSYFTKKTYVEMGEAWHLNLDYSDADNGVLVEYSFIPKFQAKVRNNRALSWTDTDDDTLQYLELKHDTYVSHLELDIALSNLDLNYMNVLLFQPPWDIQEILNPDLAAEVFGQIVDADFQTKDQTRASNIIDTLVLSGTQGGGSIGVVNATIAVDEFLPAGTLFVFKISGALATSETVNMAVQMKGLIASKGSYAGVNHLESELVRLLVNNELGDV